MLALYNEKSGTLSDVNGWVAVILGLLTATSTVIVGILASRSNGRDLRDNLKRDIEIANSFTPQSSTRRLLESHIAHQARVIVNAERMKKPARLAVAMYALALGTLIAKLVMALARGDGSVDDLLSYASLMFGVMAGLSVGLLIYATRRVDRQISTYYEQN